MIGALTNPGPHASPHQSKDYATGTAQFPRYDYIAPERERSFEGGTANPNSQRSRGVEQQHSHRTGQVQHLEVHYQAPPMANPALLINPMTAHMPENQLSPPKGMQTPQMIAPGNHSNFYVPRQDTQLSRDSYPRAGMNGPPVSIVFPTQGNVPASPYPRPLGGASPNTPYLGQQQQSYMTRTTGNDPNLTIPIPDYQPPTERQIAPHSATSFINGKRMSPIVQQDPCCNCTCCWINWGCLDPCCGYICRCDPNCYSRCCRQCCNTCGPFLCCQCNKGISDNKCCQVRPKCCNGCCFTQPNFCGGCMKCSNKFCRECCCCQDKMLDKCLSCQGRCCGDVCMCQDDCCNKCCKCQSKCCTECLGGICACIFGKCCCCYQSGGIRNDCCGCCCGNMGPSGVCDWMCGPTGCCSRICGEKGCCK